MIASSCICWAVLGKFDGSEARGLGEEVGLFGLGGVELAVLHELELVVHE